MTPAIIFAMNNRPIQSQIIFNTIDRLRSAFPKLEYIAAVSCDEDEDLCARQGIDYVICPQNLAGLKFETAMEHALATGHSHVIIMGDDDSISNDGLQMLLDAASRGIDYAGFKSHALYDMNSGVAMTHTQPYSCNKLIGAGRIISARAIELVRQSVVIEYTRTYEYWTQGERARVPREVAEYLCGYYFAKMHDDSPRTLWNTLANSGLDHWSEMNLVSVGVTPVALDNGRIHITDFKHEKNIWPFSILENKCRKCDEETAIWFMSEREREYLYTIKTIQK